MKDETEDDLERLLYTAVPRRAPTELRAAVIAAVAVELHTRRRAIQPAWQGWVLRAVAASLLVSVATFVGVSWLEDRRMARWDKGAIVRSDVAETTAAVASVSDEESARGVERYLLLQLQAASDPTVPPLLKNLQEIRRWAEDEPLAEGNEFNEKTQERI